VEQLGLRFYGVAKVVELWIILGFTRDNPNIIRPSFIILIISGFIQASIGILQFRVQHDLGLRILGEYIPGVLEDGTATLQTTSGKLIRSYGTMPHPNVYGGFLSIILAIWYYVSRETKISSKWIIISCGTFVLWWGLLVSFSRSAWIAAFLISGLFICNQFWKKAYKQAIIWSIITIVSCGTLAIFYDDIVFPRSKDIGIESQASQYRQDFNKYGWETFKNHLFIGVGANQYILNLEKTASLEPWQFQPAHNIFLMYLAEFGIIGLFIAILALFRLGFTWNNLNLLKISLIIAILVLGTFDHYLITIQQGILVLAFGLGVIVTKKDVSQL
jgi:hypothetical protein